jgi:hypothetical protein
VSTCWTRDRVGHGNSPSLNCSPVTRRSCSPVTEPVNGSSLTGR